MSAERPIAGGRIGAVAEKSMQQTDEHGCIQADEHEPPVVLLAEDHEDTRRVYGLVLRHFGYRVAEATNGYDAVEMTRRWLPKLVLMDIGLPGLDGWQASRILKADPVTTLIPLIAFSARVDSTEDLTERPTFDGYILKPVSPLELVRRVNAYMELLS
jgi:CheY-like chemotaxis protein